jgi:hypothetical protein
LIDTKIDGDLIPFDKVGALFSFIVKASYPIEEQDLKKLLRSFKRLMIAKNNEISIEAEDSEKQVRDLLTTIAIFLKCS